jgi:hypothetical protein
MSQETQASSKTTSTTHFTVKAAALIALLAVTVAFFNSLRTTIPRSLSKTPALSRNMSTNAYKVTRRPWDARGMADHGWLYSFHTFSFASYYNPKFESFGPLRVINEDRVEKTTGFGTHSHAEFLIWSYIVDGELEHKDSMGNLEKLRRGEVQFTSAGTGIRHSEYNRNKEEVSSSIPISLSHLTYTNTLHRMFTSSRFGRSPTSAASSLHTTPANIPTKRRPISSSASSNPSPATTLAKQSTIPSQPTPTSP